MISGENELILLDELRQRRDSARRGSMLLTSSALALMISVVWSGTTTCMCGHTGISTAWVVAPALAISLWMQRKCGRVSLGYRIASWIFLAGTLLLAAKVVADVLWLGHDPLFP